MGVGFSSSLSRDLPLATAATTSWRRSIIFGRAHSSGWSLREEWQLGDVEGGDTAKQKESLFAAAVVACCGGGWEKVMR